MRKHDLACAIVGIALGPLLATTAATAEPIASGQSLLPWATVVSAEARYYAWSNSLGSRGAQFYLPLAVQFSNRPSSEWKVEYLLRSGYIWTRQTTSTSSAESSSMTDSTVAATVTYYGWNGVQPFVALNTSVPTANWTWSGSAGSSSTSRTDSDIIATPVVGQGWNVGPSVGANIALAPTLIATVGFGYTYRGPFDGGPLATALGRLNPGDVSTVNAGLGWSGERAVVQTAVSYSWETISYLNGAPIYRAGDRIIAVVKGGYAWDRNWSSRAAFHLSHFAKNEVPLVAGIPPLVREAFNSNSTVYRVTFEQLYSRDNYSVGPTVTFLYRDRNGYDPMMIQFVPAKSSWSAGGVAQIAASERVAINLRGEHIWVDEKANPANGIPAFTTRAWVVSIGGSARF
jgi:hypothetical protein